MCLRLRINYPAASSGVLNNICRTTLIVYDSLLLYAIVCILCNDYVYICTYHIFIRMFAYGRCKIAICPKFSTPQLILYFWNSQKYLPRRYTLQLCHNLSWAIRRNRLDKKMDMISFCTYFQKSYLKSLRNFVTDSRNSRSTLSLIKVFDISVTHTK